MECHRIGRGRQRSRAKLDPFNTYVEERLQAGMWNAPVLMRELRERSFTGSYTLLTDWLRPQTPIRTRHGGAPIRDTARQTGASGLGSPGLLHADMNKAVCDALDFGWQPSVTLVVTLLSLPKHLQL
jgi:hypothetical protein